MEPPSRRRSLAKIMHAIAEEDGGTGLANDAVAPCVIVPPAIAVISPIGPVTRDDESATRGCVSGAVPAVCAAAVRAICTRRCNSPRASFLIGVLGPPRIDQSQSSRLTPQDQKDRELCHDALVA
jgi:hypothetical protein